MSDGLAKRFWAKVDRNGPVLLAELGPCWVWTAADIETGYGLLKVAGKLAYAHRTSWILEHGEIPPGLCVLHRCDNPPCVRPAHLFLGRKKDNTTDARRKGRLLGPRGRCRDCRQLGHVWTKCPRRRTA